MSDIEPEFEKNVGFEEFISKVPTLSPHEIFVRRINGLLNMLDSSGAKARFTNKRGWNWAYVVGTKQLYLNMFFLLSEDVKKEIEEKFAECSELRNQDKPNCMITDEIFKILLAELNLRGLMTQFQEIPEGD